MDRRESLGTMFRQQLRDSRHLQSAGTEDRLSPLQLSRQQWEPVLPVTLRSPVCIELLNDAAYAPPEKDQPTLKKLFPFTYDQKFCKLVPSKNPLSWQSHPPLRIGVVLSGGQAPGGHNVISGVYDYVKQCNGNSQVFGFVGGPAGIYEHKYVEISDEFMGVFRNMGGFDMIRSGRHKIETDEQKLQSMNICKKLDLHGLVVIGGDDSNTNAAILAEVFKANGCTTRVIGCPKTIDGDLKNEFVETSFGFDTAVKTYSEFIGNLCADVATSGKYYHFIRLMGRSASNIALECALQTRPNFTLIGEEIQLKNSSLETIVSEIVDMVIKRHQMGKDYGVVLLPEGLIEFVPEIGSLIAEINKMQAAGTDHFDAANITPDNRKLFESLPESIRVQLLLDRDPHGNVQVAMIATERLVILMVQEHLKKSNMGQIFNPVAHYFGYEGRCGMPSNFDANYCYSLGHVAGALVDNGVTGCMAVVRKLNLPTTGWEAAGCPLTIMMNIEHRKGKDVPVIKKYLVELEGPMFLAFAEARESWKWDDMYKSPGPIQFDGPVCNVANNSIIPTTREALIPPMPSNIDSVKRRHFFPLVESQMSALQIERLNAQVPINPILTCKRSVISKTPSLASPSLPYAVPTPMSANGSSKLATVPRGPKLDVETQSIVMQHYPKLSQLHSNSLAMDLCVSSDSSVQVKEGLRVGVALTGQQAPGVANVLWGLFERLHLNKGMLFGFKGAQGLIEGDYIEIKSEDLVLSRNQGGFTLLGRTADYEGKIAAAESANKIRSVCQKLNLDGLIMIGGRWALTDTSILAENFIQHGMATKVIGVPASQNNNIATNFIECNIGFDTASKCYSQLIGNLLTDAASATKYWYFVRLMGRDKSHMVLETALQSHPNVTLVSESYAAGDKTLEDVVMDIADIVCARSEEQKNFGALLIPEGLISELPQMRQLLAELTEIISSAKSDKDMDSIIRELVEMDETTSTYRSRLSKVSSVVLSSLPQFIRQQIIQPRFVGRLKLSHISTEELLSKMVQTELQKRKTQGSYKGQFSAVCFYFGYQARSSLPSQFDCALGLSHGYLAGLCVESGMTGLVTSMRGLCGPTNSWRPTVFPVTTIMKMQQEELYAIKVPMVPSSTVNLDCRALRKVQSASAMWEQEDRFCNPGPLQFYGSAKHFYNRYLFEQQHHYLKMLNEIADHISYLQKICTFGVDESLIRTSCICLEMLRKLVASQTSHDDEFSQRIKENYTSKMTGGISMEF